MIFSDQCTIQGGMQTAFSRIRAAGRTGETAGDTDPEEWRSKLSSGIWKELGLEQAAKPLGLWWCLWAMELKDVSRVFFERQLLFWYKSKKLKPLHLIRSLKMTFFFVVFSVSFVSLVLCFFPSRPTWHAPSLSCKTSSPSCCRGCRRPKTLGPGEPGDFSQLGRLDPVFWKASKQAMFTWIQYNYPWKTKMTYPKKGGFLKRWLLFCFQIWILLGIYVIFFGCTWWEWIRNGLNLDFCDQNCLQIRWWSQMVECCCYVADDDLWCFPPASCCIEDTHLFWQTDVVWVLAEIIHIWSDSLWRIMNDILIEWPCKAHDKWYNSIPPFGYVYMDVSKNGGAQQPWVFLLKMIILGCFGGTPIFGNTNIYIYTEPFCRKLIPCFQLLAYN